MDFVSVFVSDYRESTHGKNKSRFISLKKSGITFVYRHPIEYFFESRIIRCKLLYSK